MKLFTLAVILLGTTVAFAFPTKGDRVVYITTAEKSDPKKSELTLEYLNQGFDPLKNVWNVDFVNAQDGVVLNQGTQEYAPDDMITSETMMTIMQNCTAAGGTSESITVTAGTFDSCHFKDRDADFWYGNVPFGVIAFTALTNKVKHSYELSVLELGTPSPTLN